jgi:EAL domain-containing protein (putative c-di-GMP-specific phosphodiesterase class I)
MIDDGFLKRQIQAMKGKGFMFVLDDYGTGYSNLSRLKNCPFINVKLDMSLVWDYIKSPDKILPSMIEAFRHMGFSITAEGIEDETMAATMTDIGCDYLQGYHFSKPLPIDEFVVKYGG